MLALSPAVSFRLLLGPLVVADFAAPSARALSWSQQQQQGFSRAPNRSRSSLQRAMASCGIGSDEVVRHTTTTACTGGANNDQQQPLPSNTSPQDLLASSWTTAAPGYDRIFVPRFAPWTDDALTALEDALAREPLAAATSDGGGGSDSVDSTDNGCACITRALVPCCGPGQELVRVSELLGPGAQVLGVDLAPGMVRAAKRRLLESEANVGDRRFNITVQVGDAMDPPLGPYRALLSVFGLQQLPDPLGAIKTWVGLLDPGGVAVVCYWPPGKTDDGGPFELWGNIVRRKLGPPKQECRDWDEDVVNAIKEAGAEILEDRVISHGIRWDDPVQFWNGMTQSGPWHIARLRRGDEFVDGLGEELRSAYPPDEALVHSPRARMIVLQRTY